MIACCIVCCLERGLDIVQIFLYSPLNGGRYEGDKLPKRKRLWP